MNHDTPVNIPHTLLAQLIEEAKADEVGLWYIIGLVRDELGVTEPESLRASTLQCVNALLASGGVVAGYYRPDGSGVEVWDMEPDSIVFRIQQEWNKLGREPNIGEIVVLIGSGTAST